MLIITTSLLNIAHNHWIPCIALRKSIKFLLSIPSSGHSSHGWCAGLQTQSTRGPGFYKSDSFLTMILAHVVWRCVLMIIIWYFNCDGEWRWYWYCDDTLTGSTSGWWQRNAAHSRREHKRSDYHDWGKSGCHDHRGQHGHWTMTMLDGSKMLWPLSMKRKDAFKAVQLWKTKT